MPSKIGYIRVSSFYQNHERQLESIKLDKCFIDKVSGKSIERPQLKEMLNYVREGDTVYIHSMDRLARNLDDLRKIVKQLTNQKITINFLKENLIFKKEEKDSPMSSLLLSIMGAFAEFERELIKERQREGIEIAKKKGLYKGRKPCLTKEQITELKQRILTNKENKTDIAKYFNISRETVYKYLKKDNKE